MSNKKNKKKLRPNQTTYLAPCNTESGSCMRVHGLGDAGSICLDLVDSDLDNCTMEREQVKILNRDLKVSK